MKFLIYIEIHSRYKIKMINYYRQVLYTTILSYSTMYIYIY